MEKLEIKDLVALTLLFLVAFWLWTLPIQENPLPFGEHDGAYIFSYGDDMAYKDKSYDLVGDTPTSVDFWYPGWNTVLGPKAMQYPPPYNLGYAFAQIFGGERIIPPYIFIAVTCFAGLFSVYILMRKLYGFEAALISSMAVLFCYRVIMLYLWGQRHNVTAFVYVPIAIYALYRYLSSFYENKEKIAYLYVFVLLFLCTYLAHLGATAFLAPYTLVLVSLMSIKYKRVPFSTRNIKHYVILGLLFTLIVGQFYLMYFGPEDSVGADLGFKDLGSLFHWHKIPENKYAMNPAFSEYNPSYIGKWTLVLLLAGILLVLKRRNKEDLVIISALITLYMVFHLTAFGITKEGSYRIGRFMVLEAYFFYALMAIAITSIPSLLKLSKSGKKYLRSGLTFLFIVILISTQGAQAYKSLKGAYPPILRITPAQYELTEWIQENIPEESALHIRGTLTYPKKGFIQILSRRAMDRSEWGVESREIRTKDIIKEGMIVPEQFVDGTDWVIYLDYAIIDYSDLILIGDNTKIEELRKIENNILSNSTLIYNKNNIRVYKFD